MNNLLIEVSIFALLPSLCMLIGGLIPAFYTPGEKFTSATQHFAAGVVFAAVAKELLPKVGAAHAPIALVIGFSLGILLMFIAKWFSEKLEEMEQGENSVSFGLVAAVAIDVFIDGLLIGIAFLAGEQGGILIAIALAIEIFFLGLSTIATLTKQKASLSLRIITTIVLALIVPIGAILGVSVFAHFPKVITDGVLAFGVAALLYLVTEELLVEAHEVEETPLITISFFIGFLVILMLEP